MEVNFLSVAPAVFSAESHVHCVTSFSRERLIMMSDMGAEASL